MNKKEYNTIKDKEGKEYIIKTVEMPLGANQTKMIYLAFNGKGEKVGQAAVTLIKEGNKREAKISDVETKAKYRNKGIATSLLNLVEETAIHKGYGNKINLFVVDGKAGNIYKKRGFGEQEKLDLSQIKLMIKKSPSRKARETWAKIKKRRRI